MKKANWLINEKSPYLLQHAYNPIDWYPWGDEAFAKAKEEDKPVFLSIGYSTCHWCHVMEHESFEDEETAALLNKYFVPIKVDREERPDIDNIYMQVCQMITGSGGWPLTIFITHDKKPFFAGTYFPKDDRFGKMGLMSLLPRIQELWVGKREDILRTTDELVHALNHTEEVDNIELDEQILHKCYNALKKNYNPHYGGFSAHPKFPSPHNFLFLLRYWRRTKDPDAIEMVVNTLLHMRRGGIYDQIGFGFHRYSTDSKWLVPHFEKMLYDQALIAMAYTETYQAVNHMSSERSEILHYVSSPEVVTASGIKPQNPPYNAELFRNTAEEIFTYVLRDMTSPDGGFYSAEDADSEGEEGKFYLWDAAELNTILGSDAQRAIRIFNVMENGNWEDPVNPGLTHTNILHLSEDQPFNILPEIEATRKKLFDVREKRVHPHKDDKILTDWNGLMISALARGAAAFDNKVYSDAAEKSISFIFSKLFKRHKLLHRYRDGEASIDGNCSDYAFMIQGLLDTYEATFNLDYLKKALQLNDIMIRDFWDENVKGFYFTSPDNKDVIARQKELYDGAIPSGNSVALFNLVRLGKFTGVSKYEIMASELSSAFSNQAAASPSAYTYAISAMDFAFGPSMEVVISEGKNKEAVDQFIKAIRSFYNPNKVILYKSDINDPGEVAMYTNNLLPLNSKTSVYICRDYVCEMPVTDPGKIIGVMK